jgi:hypothetical protein
MAGISWLIRFLDGVGMALAIATGALGRTTELVVSFDGFCRSSASTPDVELQPERHSAAIKKLVTPANRIWTCTQNTTDRGRDGADGQTSPSYEREITNKV